jgi:hypothetical protein
VHPLSFDGHKRRSRLAARPCGDFNGRSKFRPDRVFSKGGSSSLVLTKAGGTTATGATSRPGSAESATRRATGTTVAKSGTALAGSALALSKSALTTFTLGTKARSTASTRREALMLAVVRLPIRLTGRSLCVGRAFGCSGLWRP